MDSQTKKEIKILKNEIKELKEANKQHFSNEADLSNRLKILEEDSVRNHIVKDLNDASKTNKANFTIKEIAERNNVSEYEVHKIQKEECLSRNTNGQIIRK